MYNIRYVHTIHSVQIRQYIHITALVLMNSNLLKLKELLHYLALHIVCAVSVLVVLKRFIEFFDADMLTDVTCPSV
jgi:hypothetical protein